MSAEDKKYATFQVAGYECTIKFIRAEPGNRFEVKKNHLLVWVEFSPCVGNVISTGVEIPIRKYDRQSLLSSIQNATNDRIGQMLNDQRAQRKAKAEAEVKRIALDTYAEGISSLLEVKDG